MVCQTRMTVSHPLNHMDSPPPQDVAEARSKLITIITKHLQIPSLRLRSIANYVPTRKRAVADFISKVAEEVPSQVATQAVAQAEEYVNPVLQLVKMARLSRLNQQ